MSKRKAPSMPLRAFFEDVYRAARPLSRDATLTYRAAITSLEQFAKRELLVTDLSVDLMQRFLTAYRAEWSAASTNNKRKNCLALWTFAWKRGLHPEQPAKDEIPKMKTEKRNPDAWSLEEVKAMLKACAGQRRIERRGVVWDVRHWKAFLLVQWDSAHRRGCLLSYPNIEPPRITTRRNDIDPDGMLLVHAAHTKQSADVIHRLHPDTLAAIAELPEHEALFPFPYTERSFDTEWKLIVARAGLRTTRRDGSQKMRRSSATAMAIAVGETAAIDHLGHATPRLAREHYLDATKIPKLYAADYLPRPTDEKTRDDDGQGGLRIFGAG